MKGWMKIAGMLSCGLLLLVAEVSAQIPPEDAFDRYNMYRYKEADGRVMANLSPRNSDGETDGVGRFNEGNYTDGAFTMADQWCPTDDNGVVQPCSGIPSDQYHFEGGERKSNLVALSPMAGFHDTMKSKVYTKALDAVLDSDLAVMNVTWMLTEPGVSRGLYQATNMANHWLDQRYKSDMAFLKRAEQMGEARELVLQSYNSCIADYMTGKRDHVTGDKLRWIEAQSRCLGGERYVEADSAIEKWDDISNQNVPLKLIDLTAHPEGQNANADGTSTQIWDSAENKIKDNDQQDIDDHSQIFTLVDWIFQEERNARHIFDYPGAQGNGDNKQVVNWMKADWRKTFGDVVFTLNVHPFDDGINSHRVQEFQYKRIAPHESTEYRTGPEWYKRGLTRQIFHQITAIMFNYCQFKNNTASGGLDPHDMERADRFAGKGRYDFWNDQAYLTPDYNVPGPGGTCGACVKKVEAFSGGDQVAVDPLFVRMQGFSLQPHVGDLLWWMFAREEGSSNNGKWVCEDIDPRGAGNIDQIMTDPQYDLGGFRLRNNVNTRTRSWWYLADRIATGQFLMTVKRAEDVVMKISGGAFDNTARGMALEMLKQAVGRQPMDRAVEHNLQRLDQWLEVWYHRRANQIGSTDVFAQDKQREEGTPMNGYAGTN